MKDSAREYLRHVMREKNLTATALAKIAGVSSSTITRPLSQGDDYEFKISRQTLEKVAASTGIPFSDTTPVRVEVGDPIPHGASLIPVYDVAASAGPGSVVDYEATVHSLAFPPEYLSKLTSGSTQFLSIISVKGESMEPTLLDDDIVLLDASKTNLSFDGLFVLRFNDALHVKRIGRSAKSGHVMIISDNNSLYPPLEAPIENITAIGKVLWYGRKV